MLSREEYIQLSLQLNLFWVRIMKEHAIFIEGSIPPPGKQLASQASRFKQQFERLLASSIKLANGSVSREALHSGQYYTRYTEEAELIVQKYTSIPINSGLTLMEYNIEPFNPHVLATPRKEQDVMQLNQRILNQTDAFARFKTKLKNDQNSCRLFTFLYSADLDHILNEAINYIEILSRLQRKDDDVIGDYKKFWTHNMSDHAKSMRGLLDPTETKYFELSDQFAKTFDSLSNALPSAEIAPVNNELLADTKALSDFKSDITQGIIECKIKSLMLPLYTDHLLREANHFIYLMQY